MIWLFRGFYRFAFKDNCKTNKKFIANGNGDSPQTETNISSPALTNGNGQIMRSSMPLIKVMNKDERRLRYESSQVKSWSVKDVAQFIRSIGLVEHALHFEEQVMISLETFSVFSFVYNGFLLQFNFSSSHCITRMLTLVAIFRLLFNPYY